MTPYTDEQKADLAKRIEALCEALAGLDLNDAHDLYANAALIPRALTAIRQLQNPWLPIESAPRDGTIAVLYSPRDWETSVTPARKMAIQLEVAVFDGGKWREPGTGHSDFDEDWRPNPSKMLILSPPEAGG